MDHAPLLMHWPPAGFATLLVIGLLMALAGLLRAGGRAGLPTTKICPSAACGHRNPPNARFCARCGKKLPSHCCQW